MSTTPMEMQDMQMSQPASMSHLSVFHFSQTEVILFPFWEISGALSESLKSINIQDFLVNFRFNNLMFGCNWRMHLIRIL